MPVMNVGHMGMAVPTWLVPVSMAVRTFLRRVVGMFVMTVIVPMRMFMLQRLVLMRMVVRLGQMQGHADQHQQAAQGHAPTG